MSDISDVLSVLVRLIADTIYPLPPNYDVSGKDWDDGARFDREPNPILLAAQPKYDGSDAWDSGKAYDIPTGVSISGTPVIIYAGWPASATLAKDLSIGKTHITVFPKAEERNTTRYGQREYVTLDPAPTIIFSVYSRVAPQGKYDAITGRWDSGSYDIASSTDLTVGGTASAPQNLALRINNKFYVYAVQINDTLTSIASNLGSLVTADFPATTISGQVITLPWNARLQAARAGGFGTVAKELRRQERVIQITVWTNAPKLRDTISSAVDVALAKRHFITMPDGYAARLIYKNSLVVDALQKDALYRRDLNYTVEYATTSTEQVAAVIAPSANVNDFIITF